MQPPPDSANIQFIHGFRVTIVKYPGNKWFAQWRGKDNQLVRIQRESKHKLITAIDQTMKLRQDI